ncbi:hypothetical protein OROHE_001190 [Orobanche hederae]
MEEKDSWNKKRWRFDVPKVFVENKADAKTSLIYEFHDIPRNPSHGMDRCRVYQVSALCNYQIEDPFLYLAKKMTGIEDLTFVCTPIVKAPLPEIEANLAWKLANAPKLFVGMILILILTEALALYGLIWESFCLHLLTRKLTFCRVGF